VKFIIKTATGVRALVAAMLMLLAPFSVAAAPERIMISEPYSPYENAARWYGVDERTDRSRLMSLFSSTVGNRVDPVQTAWCAIFTDAMLVQSGYRPLNSLWARDFLKYGTPVSQPERGDIVVLSRGAGGHVGFFHKFVRDVNGQWFVGVMGGNNESASSSGVVGVAYFPLSRVLGYRTF